MIKVKLFGNANIVPDPCKTRKLYILFLLNALHYFHRRQNKNGVARTQSIARSASFDVSLPSAFTVTAVVFLHFTCRVATDALWLL